MKVIAGSVTLTGKLISFDAMAERMHLQFEGGSELTVPAASSHPCSKMLSTCGNISGDKMTLNFNTGKCSTTEKSEKRPPKEKAKS